MTPFQVATTYPFGAAATSDFRSTVIKALSVFVEPVRAAQLYDQGIATIQREAGEGAAKKVTPIVIAALAVGAVGAVLGTIAIVTSRKRHA